MLEKIKELIVRFLNVLVVALVAATAVLGLALNGAFIANIANSLRLTGYIEPWIGMQFVVVVISLLWVPIFLLRNQSR